MSELDRQALQTYFTNWKNDRAPNDDEGVAFERFTIEQILKDRDLSDEEIDIGHIGGKDDGGVDGMYLFVNRSLVQETPDISGQSFKVELVIVQTNSGAGFSENVVQKCEQFLRDMLDFSRDVDTLTYLNSLARDAITLFRQTYPLVMGFEHTLHVSVNYAIKGDTEPNTKVEARAKNLDRFIKDQLSAAEVDQEYWNCRRLLATARAPRDDTVRVPFAESFQTQAATVCLVSLTDFAKFLRDEQGSLRQSLFESNVRAYQGSVQVNRDIRRTLESPDGDEFWWLNNGITILADSHEASMKQLVVKRPQIVNGLQTSREVYEYFKMDHPSERRHILIRVLNPPSEATRNRIIKATNFQTSIPSISLHATEPLHEDIEEHLKLYGLFYDRRRRQYREQRKPISKIVSMVALGSAVIAIWKQLPDEARARPQSYLSPEPQYKEVFAEGRKRDFYLACILIDRAVDAFLEGQATLTSDMRRDMRHYMSMWVACALAKKSKLTEDDVVRLANVKPVPEWALEEALTEVSTNYFLLGQSDKVAKSPSMRISVLQSLQSRYPG